MAHGRFYTRRHDGIDRLYQPDRPRFGKDQHSPEDYLLGGRKIPGWAIGFSVMATQASAITFIGAPGWGFEGGLERPVTFINVPLAMIVLIMVFAPVFHRSGIYSIYELLERLFGPATRTLSALLFLIARGLATGVVLYAPRAGARRGHRLER